MRTVIAMVAIQDGSVLLVRKFETWIFPGGKPETGESNIQCLIREVGEELPGIQLKNFRFYRVFEGRAPHLGDIVQVKVYFANVKGELNPSAEINTAAWVKKTKRYKLADPTREIIGSLHQDGYL